jgi:hypothetical protein
MSEAANKALAKRWFEEVWNQGRESSIDELFHPDGKAYGFPEPDSILIGLEGFKAIPAPSTMPTETSTSTSTISSPREIASPSAGPAL